MQNRKKHDQKENQANNPCLISIKTYKKQVLDIKRVDHYNVSVVGKFFPVALTFFMEENNLSWKQVFHGTGGGAGSEEDIIGVLPEDAPRHRVRF